jgi:HPt (histidine-containing phosphotransfer) domain-containing protein
MQPTLRPGPPAAETAAQLQARIDAVWQRNRPLILDRVRDLLRTAAAARLGQLTPALAAAAAETAHKLAGSLGMFGYPEGTLLARAFERSLTETTPPDAPTLSRLSAALSDMLVA